MDVVTGFEGIITGKIVYLFGCSQYGIVPPVLDNKTADCQWFDEGRIRITGDGVTAEEVDGPKTGGINRDCPK